MKGLNKMEIRLAYENEFVADFNFVVDSFKPAEFKSPRRSTVPLLLYWKDYQKRFITKINFQI